MNYDIYKEQFLHLDGNGKAVVRVELLAASAEALPAYNAIPGRILAEGSVAVLPSTGAVYMLDFDNTWKEW